MTENDIMFYYTNVSFSFGFNFLFFISQQFFEQRSFNKKVFFKFFFNVITAEWNKKESYHHTYNISLHDKITNRYDNNRF